MTFIPVPQGASVTFNWDNGGALEYKNRIWVTKAGFSQADLQTLADSMLAGVAAATVLTSISNDFRCASVTVTDETGEGQPSATSTGAAVVGGNSSPALPASVAMVVTLRTGYRGRSYRGRFYAFGFCENNIEDGLWSTTLRTDVLAFLTGIDGRINSAGWDWVIASKQHNHEVTSPAVVHPVTDRVVRSLIPGTQRRRNHRP